jgi:hypothetical protein
VDRCWSKFWFLISLTMWGQWWYIRIMSLRSFPTSMTFWHLERALESLVHQIYWFCSNIDLFFWSVLKQGPTSSTYCSDGEELWAYVPWRFPLADVLLVDTRSRCQGLTSFFSVPLDFFAAVLKNYKIFRCP